jgi:hypothetical protein
VCAMLFSILAAFTRKTQARSSKLSHVFNSPRRIPAGRAMTARAIGLLALPLLALTAEHSFAAASAGCNLGGFSLLGLSGKQRGVVPAGSVPNSCDS